MYDGTTDSYAHRDGTPYPKRDQSAPAGSLPIEAETLAPRVYIADHGEQDGIAPDRAALGRINPGEAR
jgi:hypothetical protein